jgi:iron complex outermembrane receptor protein
MQRHKNSMRKFSLMAIAASTGAMAIATIATPALAQSSGTLDFDKDIVVTGSATPKGISGVVVPDTSKAKGELTQDWIQHQVPGQSINEMINYLPGVSFQNGDPYGSTSGTLSIRGFDSTRISETFDGMTLNDDGGYALYSGELLDSEVIDKVTVNLGTTDVDSPTSSASGSTVNFISHMPSDDFHVKVAGSAGTDAYMRMFGMIETGKFGPWGTKAWLSASTTGNNSPYNNYGKIRKDEYNGKIYQELGTNGDFLSLAGFYVKIRNNFSGSVPLANAPLAADSGAGLTYMPTNYKAAYYNYAACTTTVAHAGIADKANTCGSAYDYRANPANLANIRGSARFTLTDKLVLNIDPSYQFTKANGGGTVAASEGTSNGSTGFINGTYYLGKDLNGDGDTLDTVRVLAPSETKTHRVALTSSLRYDISHNQTVRLAYAFSRSVITQSGELGYINSNGSPVSVYENGITDASGNVVQKRDTQSIAMLNQISGEYRGKFFDDKMTLTAGVRAPFLHRELTNYCFTRSASASVTCAFGTSGATYAAANPSFGQPQTKTYNYSAVLPNAGVTYHLPGASELFANYSKGMSAPATTSLYQAFWPGASAAASTVAAEKTDNFDLGYRYNTSRLSAQLDLWYTHFTNRLGSAYNPNDNTSIYTNLGSVNRYGFDGNVSYQIVPQHLSAYVFGSWLHSKIANNVYGTLSDGTTGLLQTAGKFESAVPVYTVGGRIQGTEGPVTIGVQAKRTGPRYVNDQNTPYYLAGTNNGTVVYQAQAAAYTTVDLDARVALTAIGLNDRSFFQLNVTNLFNKFYVGGFSGTYNNQVSYTGTYTNAQISSPRAIMGTFSMAY